MNHTQGSAPILIMAFARPQQTSRLLTQVENLGVRSVHISIDGADAESKFRLQNQIVRTVVLNFSQSSKHNVTFTIHEQSLGLLQHFKIALNEFFSTFNSGIVLEDDMEFAPSFIKFVDLHYNSILMRKYWSICGHNPTLVANKRKGEPCRISFFETDVHTIWGWASTQENVFRFINFLESSQKQVLDSVHDFSHKKFKISMLRKLFSAIWQMKVNRFFNSRSPNWDNMWVIAGWDSGKRSLMPEVSLVREHSDQSEGQTHPHFSNYDSVNSETFLKTEIDGIRNSNNGVYEFRLLRVWGINLRSIMWFNLSLIKFSFAKTMKTERKHRFQ